MSKTDPELDVLKAELDETFYFCSVRKLNKAGRDRKVDVILVKFQGVLDQAISKAKAEVLAMQPKPKLATSGNYRQPLATQLPNPNVAKMLEKMPKERRVVGLATSGNQVANSVANPIQLWVKAHGEGQTYRQIAANSVLNPRGVSHQFITKKVNEYLSNHPEEK